MSSYRKAYKDDPRWIIARFNSEDADGKPVRKGEEVLYYPLSRTILSGERAKQAWREFEAAEFDEWMLS